MAGRKGRNTATKSAETEARRKKRAAWWKVNAQRIKEEVRINPLTRYNALKSRAAREDRKFSISYKAYLDKLQKGCYYCGADLMKECGGSMDRLNNDNRNYFTKGVVPCCASCNKVKSNMLTPDEMLAAMKAVVKYRKEKGE